MLDFTEISKAMLTYLCYPDSQKTQKSIFVKFMAYIFLVVLLTIMENWGDRSYITSSLIGRFPQLLTYHEYGIEICCIIKEVYIGFPKCKLKLMICYVFCYK